MKKSLRPLDAPPPKLSSPMKAAMRGVSHALALGTLLVSGAVWTISQQHPLYANPGKLLRLPAAVVDASQPTEQAFRIGEVLNQYTHDRTLAFSIEGQDSVSTKFPHTGAELAAGPDRKQVPVKGFTGKGASNSTV